MALYPEQKLQTDIQQIKDHFAESLKQLRVGRPRVDTFAGIMVSAYGTESQLSGLANIMIENATMVAIQPWDKSIVNDIVKAIQDSQLGYSAAPDGEKVRVSIPALTEERRQETIKELGAMLEEAKVSVRQVRHKYNEMVEKADGVSEDEQKRDREAIQKQVDQANKDLEELAAKKETELETV